VTFQNTAATLYGDVTAASAPSRVVVSQDMAAYNTALKALAAAANTPANVVRDLTITS
jgi:hypothetical protein